MTPPAPLQVFRPFPPDPTGIISWVHIGDLHMTGAGKQNHRDLAAIVNEINRVFATSISFVFFPGDVADDGSASAYAVVRGELDRLTVPWCAILGDHDVHEKSFANFLAAMAPQTHYAFTVGSVRFLALNAFDVPHPASFTVTPGQLAWVKRELQAATDAAQRKVVLLHCYPSDLKSGAAELTTLLHTFNVVLVDMGHTHYNELANDGHTLYSATRSTGQIEEGPVGYSITNLDGDTISWRFVELGKLPVAIITSPSDERLVTTAPATPSTLTVRAKFWGDAEAVKATAHLDNQTVPMQRINNTRVWQASIPTPPAGIHPLTVSIEDQRGNIATDAIRIATGQRTRQNARKRDQDNVLEAWPEHGLLGTQLGPNKNGKKW